MEQVHLVHVKINVRLENIVLQEVHHVQTAEMENGVVKAQAAVVI